MAPSSTCSSPVCNDIASGLDHLLTSQLALTGRVLNQRAMSFFLHLDKYICFLFQLSGPFHAAYIQILLTFAGHAYLTCLLLH